LYIKDNIVFRVFTLEFTTKEPLFYDESLYGDIKELLKQHLDAYVPVIFDNHRQYQGSNEMHYMFDIHIGSLTKPEEIRLDKVQNILGSALFNYPLYTCYKISIN